MKNIGLTFKALRIRDNLTLRELAKKAHIQYSQLSNIETCKRMPSLETMEKLCVALGVAVSEVVFLTELEIKHSEKLQKAHDALVPYFNKMSSVIDNIYESDTP